MLLELDTKITLKSLSKAIARHGSARDHDAGFPKEGFAELAEGGFLSHPPVGSSEMRPLLMLLAAVGRGDLSVGRIFEGHVNAVYLIQKYGSAVLAKRFTRTVAKGGILGVWNTDAPNDPLRIAAGKFDGKKSFASGVDGLSHAIVTVSDETGRQMYVVPTDKLGVDRSWWRPLGMRASGSHVVDFAGLRAEPEWMLGRANDYVEQP
jgi:alkylation response protein AidB-like acyl-CoA dehydrogenase